MRYFLYHVAIRVGVYFRWENVNTPLFFARVIRYQAGVETCLILGELQMGTDALLSAILSGVLSPSAQPLEFGHAAVTVADIEEVRSSVPTDLALLPWAYLIFCVVVTRLAVGRATRV